MNIDFLNKIIELFLLHPIAQSIGFVAMICVWIAFLYNDDLKTIKMLLIANLFWWLVFILLDSYAGLIAIIIASIRLILSIKYKKNLKVFLFLVLGTLIFWFIICDTYISLIPIIWSLIWIYIFFYFSWIQLRIWCLILSITWLIYNLLIWSIWWVINEIIVELLIIRILYKYVWINWYKHIFVSKLKSIFHPYHDIDLWRYTIIKKDKKEL